MKNWSPQRTLWTLCALTLIVSALILTGCAAPNLNAPPDRPTLPAEWSAPQSPAAKAFSEKVQSYFQRLEVYWLETPRFTTQPSAPSSDAAGRETP